MSIQGGISLLLIYQQPDEEPGETLLQQMARSATLSMIETGSRKDFNRSCRKRHPDNTNGDPCQQKL